jgi:hypothetical protein
MLVVAHVYVAQRLLAAERVECAQDAASPLGLLVGDGVRWHHWRSTFAASMPCGFSGVWTR